MITHLLFLEQCFVLIELKDSLSCQQSFFMANLPLQPPALQLNQLLLQVLLFHLLLPLQERWGLVGSLHQTLKPAKTQFQVNILDISHCKALDIRPCMSYSHQFSRCTSFYFSFPMSKLILTCSTPLPSVDYITLPHEGSPLCSV